MDKIKPEETKIEEKAPTASIPEVKEAPKVEEKPQEVKKETPKKVEEMSDDDKIRNLAEKKYKTAKENKDVYITLADETRNFWNSGDYLHFYISQGRCKKLPTEVSPILENALSEQNKLLREATDDELRKEMSALAEEELISAGEIKPRKYQETPLKL